MRIKTFVTCATAAALAIGALPAAAAIGDGKLGGPPDPSGVPDDTICAGGAAVTGITGSSRIIGGFIPIVATATVQCASGSSASTMGSMTGSPDELPGSTSCLTGQVAVGISGNEGDFVDHILLRCRNADGSGLITPSVPLFGGPFGTPDGPYDCPAGEVLTGLTGQSVFAGTTIRYVEIVCAPAPPAAGKTTTICHRTGSEKNPFVVITVSNNALPAHRKHGDTFVEPGGTCPGSPISP
jgi:hypothetical protein